jgi:hypothetical protein
MVVFVIPATQEAEMGGSLGLKLETNLAAHSDPTLKNKKEGRKGRERERARARFMALSLLSRVA